MRSRASALAYVLTIAAGLCVACSTEETSAPRGDGGAAEADAAALDSGEEDAGSSGPSFCESLDPAPFFCADFDDDPAPDTVFRTVSGAATVEDGSLRALSDGADVYVEHDHEPSPQWAVIELGFAVSVEALSSDARMTIARIGQHQTDTECRVELELEPDALTLRGGGTTAPLTKKLALRTRTRIVLTMDATSDAGSVRATVTVDGQPAVGGPLDLGCARLPGPPRVSLGRIAGAGSGDLRFDDVVFDGR